MMSGAAHPVSVLWPLMVSAAMSVVTILVHATALIAAAWLLRRRMQSGLTTTSFSGDIWLTAGIALLALASHFVEIALWAVLLVLCGEFTDFPASLYESAMNYTSLGYGDVVMSPSWKLLGPIEAATGLLMFGVSTAWIFAVMQQSLRTKFAAAPAVR
ncbi:MAG TPA: ion channel [Rhizomicrobium sp.]|nr:ion channel [Rhizomicrobium sp.]